MNSISLKAYAKIKIGLDVTGKLPDGYHLVKMIMQNIDLYDEVVMPENVSGDIRLDMNDDFLPTDERNLAYKATMTGMNKLLDLNIDRNILMEHGL